jgi:uncharacterized protein
MFRGDLLIDGYNVFHAAGIARRSYGPGEFEKARRQLLNLLGRQLLERERLRTTVVFDAPEQTLGASPPSRVHEILVLFADQEGDADAMIERLIRQNSAPRRLHVISSDRRVQRAARRRRAKCLTSELFLERIARRRTPEERAAAAEPPQKRTGLTAAGEVEAWLAVFGVDDVTEEADASSGERPVPPSQSPGGRTEKPSTPDAKKGATMSSTEVTAAEIHYWEQRIAELWEQSDDR